MASQNSNEAYDFALFEPKRQQEVPQKKSNIIELPKKNWNKTAGAKSIRSGQFQDFLS